MRTGAQRLWRCGLVLACALGLPGIVGGGVIPRADVGAAGLLVPSGQSDAPPAVVPAPRRAFLAIGDIPYTAGEVAQLRRLLDQAGRDGAPFVVHVGDIKGGIAPCTEAAISLVAGRFRAAVPPILYTPGDNEWTDCRRTLAGGHDPLERLALLRRVMFADASVLRRERLRSVVPDPAFPENAYFIVDRLLVAAVHVVGSKNNHRPSDGAAMAEFRLRSAANGRLLRRATAAANLLGVEAMVIVFHANPLFERSPPLPGFVPLLDDLAAVLAAYPGPVLALHGDTHRYRLDRPWRAQSDAGLRRLWRLEVPGTPLPGGVWVRVEPAAASPFHTEVFYPSPLGGKERSTAE